VKQWCQLGFLCPAVMVASAALNFALSFQSLDWLAFRTWEAAVSVECPSGIGPFEPGKVYRKDHAYGDLANIGNMADMRQYRQEEFTVDRFGFRNDRPLQDAHPIGFVLGDSFTAGAGISDDDTLPEQLTRDAGGFFYNAGAVTGDLAKAEVVSSTLNLSKGTVVYQLLERTARNGPSSLEANKRACTEQWFWASTKLGRAATLFASDHSPGVLLSRKFVKLVENDYWQPNPYRLEVARRKLQNGQEILFYRYDLRPLTDEQKLTTEWRSYFEDLRQRMAERNLQVVVLVVPDKYTVYGPLLEEKAGDFGGERLLAGIEQELRKTDIPVVNLTQKFRASAAEVLARKEYIYWRDDTHWNPLGIKLAAASLWSELSKYARSPAPTATD
jgi:SGNH hydrolase-like domain, acetyltransferase AlgX